MRLSAFRIQNFRSIRDTGWQSLSGDNITCLIGQNESGKSSVLEALLSFDTRKVTHDDLRSDGSMPKVACSFDLPFNDLKRIIAAKYPHISDEAWANFKKNYRGRVNLERQWPDASEEGTLTLEEKEIVLALSDAGIVFDEDEGPESSSASASEQSDQGEMSDPMPDLSVSEFAEAVYNQAPDFALFEDFSGLLPDMIDYADLVAEDRGTEGYVGARNLFAVIDLGMERLRIPDRRMRENVIAGSSKQFSVDFQEFWQQKIGNTNKIGIEFDLKHHDASISSKAGAPFVEFWVNDGQEKLYPKQRSKGVRWFLSFYLQLKASKARSGDRGTVLLIDEPGGSLHAKAQEDLLKVLEDIKDKVQVIYTTHSPHLVQLATLYRLLAVQRSERQGDDNSTIIMDAHKLGSASVDTLLPVYALMGSDASYQNVIQKTGNIIIEEISAYYYFRAFWRLCDKIADAIHFLPATGNSNVPLLCNLFLGWGLRFSVVLDDDASGKRVFNELKKNLYGDNPAFAAQHMYLLSGCAGVEDVLTRSDFHKFVIGPEAPSYTDANSTWVKGKAKAVLALQFMHKIEAGEIGMTDLEADSQSKIREVVAAIEALKVD